MIFITSYDRPKMLLRLLKELHGKDDIVVIDDGSDYDPSEHIEYCRYYRFSHKGKMGFWVNWNYIMELAEESDHSQFYFMPDDWQDVEYNRAKYYLDNVEEAFAFNFTNNGIKANWTPIKRKEATLAGQDVYEVGFVDCGFFCPRSALQKIGFYIDSVDIQRFRRPGISSGVGQQLSNRFMRAWIKMYQPVRSMAWHDGTHESKMHPEHRKKNPLIPK